MKLTKEKIDLLVNGTRDERVYACSRSFFLFAAFYFTKFFTFKPADFHEAFYEDFQHLVIGTLKEAAWIAYRESAKTSIAKIGLSWIIARKQVIEALRNSGEDVSGWGDRLYINVDSYDKANAESILFDVVTELQGNELLIADFGHLYNQSRTKDQAQLKRVSNFVTANGIRVEAHTALTPMRGRLYQHHRPDFVLRDDLENAITAESPVVTEKIIRLLDEAKGGMAAHNASLTLGIIEEGVMGYVKRSVITLGGTGRLRFIPVVDRSIITWPDKYVSTDAEAVAINKDITDPTKRKIWLESKKRELNAGGRRVYEVEMMLDPVAAGSPFFDRALIDRYLREATEAKSIKAGLHIWHDYNPSHAYAVGADTAKGNGGDHSTSVIIDFTTRPARQIASYANNEMPADLFAHELKRQEDIYGTCLIAPEKNTESGGSCLTSLKMIYPADLLYRQVPHDRIADKPSASGELGWETNHATKYMILNDLRAAVEDGLLAIGDARILKVMRSFTHSHADELGSSGQGHSTNHFDLLMAAAICWHMRKYARVKEVKQDYEQPEFERSILIVDDHAVVRSGVRRIVEDHPDWSVVAEAADGIAKAIATEPDVVILDYALPLIDGIEATRQIRQRMPSIEVLIFTMHDNDNLLRDMVKAGARS